MFSFVNDFNLCDVCERSHREGFMLDKKCLMNTKRCEVQIDAVTKGFAVKLARSVETRSPLAEAISASVNVVEGIAGKNISSAIKKS